MLPLNNILKNLPIIKGTKTYLAHLFVCLWCTNVLLNTDHCMQNAFQYSIHHASWWDHCTLNAPNIIHHIFSNSRCVSFLITCPRVSETISFLGWTKVEHRELISNLSSMVYLSVRRYDKNIIMWKNVKIEWIKALWQRNILENSSSI